MSRDAERAGQELGRAIAEALNRVPRIYPRCEVVSTDDLADGWVVCLVGRHNRQRVTCTGSRAVEVGDLLDTAWVPGCGFVALGVPNLTAITDLGLASAVELTIAGGSVTPTRVYHAVDTEGDAASDDLETITAGSEGDLLVLRAADDARAVVLKHGVGNLRTLSGEDVSLDDASDHVLLVYDGTNWAVIGGGSGTGTGATPPHYRDGVLPVYVSESEIRVSAGAIDVDGLAEEPTDSPVLDTDVAADFVSGVSERAANTWLYVYVRRDADGGWTARLSDDPPLFADTDESFVFEAQIDGEPASGATGITYDGDTGEDGVRAGDVLRCWADADHTTVRCAWTVASIDTGTDTITVKANNNDASDDDYLTVAPGPPRYREFSGTWWRCVGVVRLDSSQEIKYFHHGHDHFVRTMTELALNNTPGDQSWHYNDVSAFVPPNTQLYSVGMATYGDANCAMYLKPPDWAVQYQILSIGHTAHMGVTLCLGSTDPAGVVTYRVSSNSANARMYMNGYVLPS